MISDNAQKTKTIVLNNNLKDFNLQNNNVFAAIDLGLNDKGELTDESQKTAIECLARFGQRLKNIPTNNIRIVGTNTLRKAKNGAHFIKQAEQSLQHSIEVIAGREEARLIYLGVAHSQSEMNQTNWSLILAKAAQNLLLAKDFLPALLKVYTWGASV